MSYKSICVTLPKYTVFVSKLHLSQYSAILVPKRVVGAIEGLRAYRESRGRGSVVIDSLPLAIEEANSPQYKKRKRSNPRIHEHDGFTLNCELYMNQYEYLWEPI